jgi:hypothetical protein
MTSDLHERLVGLQSTDELARKQKKAMTKHYWTQEDLDWTERYGRELQASIIFVDDPDHS